jgi:hypothetical protein
VGHDSQGIRRAGAKESFHAGRANTPTHSAGDADGRPVLKRRCVPRGVAFCSGSSPKSEQTPGPESFAIHPIWKSRGLIKAWRLAGLHLGDGLRAPSPNGGKWRSGRWQYTGECLNRNGVGFAIKSTTNTMHAHMLSLKKLISLLLLYSMALQHRHDVDMLVCCLV